MSGDTAHRGILVGAEGCSRGWQECNALLQATCNHATLPGWGSPAACCSVQDTLLAASMSLPNLCEPPLGSVRPRLHANSSSASLALHHFPCCCL